ncbi:MAG: hypothetical protein H7839_05045 [Magnetococcus sp. YQC-5]
MTERTAPTHLSEHKGKQPLEKNVEPVPSGLQRPLVPGLTRLLSGLPIKEEILDPANPNLIVDRDH